MPLNKLYMSTQHLIKLGLLIQNAYKICITQTPIK